MRHTSLAVRDSAWLCPVHRQTVVHDDRLRPLCDRRHRGRTRASREAAGDKDVVLAGVAEIVQQYVKAGLLDEMEIHVVLMLLGGGARLFDNMAGRQAAYECVRLVSSPAVTHYKYRRG
jgi:hypothetical protein